MSIRKQKRELEQWETATRQWATDEGRRLALALYHGRAVEVRPYTVGLVLWEREVVWSQIPARCSDDRPLAIRPGPARRGDPAPQPPVTDWLVTNYRVAGRVYSGMLRWWRWESVVGVNADLTPENEHLDINLPLPSEPVRWWGPGVAPLAVTAIHHLHGPAALLDHPGLATLRQPGAPVGELEAPPVTLRDLGL